MNRYNRYMSNHFSECRLLAHAHDNARDRAVQIHLIPGEFAVVGITDGTDAWIAPVVQGSMYFKRVDVWQMLQDLQAGKELPSPTPVSARRRVAIEDESSKTTVVQSRRRVAVEDEQQSRSRRHVAV